MYRKASFGSTLSLKSKQGTNASLRGASVDENDDANVNSDVHSPHILFLKTQGKFGSNALQPQAGGRLMTIWNYPLRSKMWRITLVAFHPRTGTFAIADERGQVYRMSMHQHTYQALRTASMPIVAMCFIACEKTHLILAHGNGTLLIVDTHKRDVVGNIQLLQADAKSIPVVRILRSHPSQPQVLIATEDNRVFLWDLTTMQCLRTLQCDDRIVDLRYEVHGDVIALTLESSGTYLYANDGSFAALGSCRLPKTAASTARSYVTAYTSVLYRVYFEEEQRTRLQLNVLLATSDRRLLSFYVGIDKDPVVSRGKNKKTQGGTAGPAAAAASAVALSSGLRLETKLFGAFPLPNPWDHVVSMMFIGEVSAAPRVLLLSSTGDVLIIESDGFQEHSPGMWTILADIPRDITQRTLDGGDPSVALLPTEPFYDGRLSSSQPDAASATGAAAPLGGSLDAAVGRMSGVVGKMDASYQHAVIIGLDGAARLFVHEAMVGYGHASGKVLKAVAVSTAATSTKTKAASYRGREHGQGQSQGAAANGLYEFFVSTDSAEAGAGDGYPSTTNRQGARPSTAAPTATGGSGGRQRGAVGTARGASSSRGGGGGGSAASVSSATSYGGDTTVGGSGGRVSQKHRNAIGQAVTRRVKWQSHSFVTGNHHTAGIPPRFLGKDMDHELLNVPLFELATLTPKERQVNRMKLEAFLHTNGEYPSRYRALVWRFLLKLPENASAFSELAKRGVHQAYEDLHEAYPIKSPKLFHRLQSLLSQLGHWAPILTQASYLPAMVFPFTVIYSNDEIAALETVMTILMYWGYSWHATHPHPPVHIVDSINKLMKLHDIKLYQHITRLDGNVGLMGWTMLSTLFSEICGRRAWLQLMDYLFTFFEDMRNVVLLPVAILRDLRVVLTSCDTLDALTHATRNQQQNLRIDVVVKALDAMKRETPAKYFTGVATKFLDNTRFEVGKRGGGYAVGGVRRRIDSNNGALGGANDPMGTTADEETMGGGVAFGGAYHGRRPRPTGHLILETMQPAVTMPSRHGTDGNGGGGPMATVSHTANPDVDGAMDEEDEARLNLALYNGTPRFPLPSHTEHYPVYDGYPKEMLDIQIRERNKVLLLSKEVQRRESTLQALEAKIEAIERDHDTWMVTHTHATRAEFEHHRAMMDQEKQYYRELQRIEEEISGQRLRALDSLEQAAKEELHVMDVAMTEAQQLLAEKELHMQETMAMNLMLQKHREVSEKAEHTTMEKLRQLRLRRTREDWLRSVSSLLKNKEEELQAETAVVQERWKRQDETLRQQREAKQAALLEREELDRMALIQEEVAQKMKRLQLARDAKLLEIERLRAVRVQATQAEDAREAAERAALFMKKQELFDVATDKATKNAAAAAAADDEENWYGGDSRSTGDVDTDEGSDGLRVVNDAEIDERARQLRTLKARQQARHAQYQQEVAQQMVASLPPPPPPSAAAVAPAATRSSHRRGAAAAADVYVDDGSSDDDGDGAAGAPRWTRSTLTTTAAAPASTASANSHNRRNGGVGSSGGGVQSRTTRQSSSTARTNTTTNNDDGAGGGDEDDDVSDVHAFSEQIDLNQYVGAQTRRGHRVLEDDNDDDDGAVVGDGRRGGGRVLHTSSSVGRLPIEEALSKASAVLLRDPEDVTSAALLRGGGAGNDDNGPPSWSATSPRPTGLTQASLVRKASQGGGATAQQWNAAAAVGASGGATPSVSVPVPSSSSAAGARPLSSKASFTRSSTAVPATGGGVSITIEPAASSAMEASSTMMGNSPMKLLTKSRSSFVLPTTTTTTTTATATMSRTGSGIATTADEAAAIQRSLRNIKAGISSFKANDKASAMATMASATSTQRSGRRDGGGSSHSTSSSRSSEDDAALWAYDK